MNKEKVNGTKITVLVPVGSKPRHKHKYVPVDVLWFNLWTVLQSKGKPSAGWVVLACECGEVKLVPARLKNPREIIDYYGKQFGLK